MGLSKWQALNGNTIVCPGTSLWRWVAGQGPRLGQAADTRLVLTSDTALPWSSTVGTLLKYETRASPMPLMGTVRSQGYFKSAWDLDYHSKLKSLLLWFGYFCFVSWDWQMEVFWAEPCALGGCHFVMGHSISVATVHGSPQKLMCDAEIDWLDSKEQGPAWACAGFIVSLQLCG